MSRTSARLSALVVTGAALGSLTACGSSSGSTNVAASVSADGVISQQWQKVTPDLTRGLFAGSAATPTTIASNGSFLLDYGQTMDQFFAFAVTDGTTCAGGVAVIPQAAAGKASDTEKPTTFAPVEVPYGQSCDAETVQNTYRPGSVRA